MSWGLSIYEASFLGKSSRAKASQRQALHKISMLSALLHEKENTIFFQYPRVAICLQQGSLVSQGCLCLLLRKPGEWGIQLAFQSQCSGNSLKYLPYIFYISWSSFTIQACITFHCLIVQNERLLPPKIVLSWNVHKILRELAEEKHSPEPLLEKLMLLV